MKNLAFALPLLLVTPLAAQDNPTEILVDVAQAICGVEDGKNQGKLTKTSFDAAAELRLKGVLKVVADAGLDAAASYNSTEYINGLANDALAGELKSIRDCNLRVFSDMSPVIIKWMEAKTGTGGGGSVIQNSNGDCVAQSSGSGNNVTVTCNGNN